ncbi:MAG: 16S rRNA (cytosine(1402)-N(4))-methyltransferase [Bacteroidetes bacterium]|nr:16S rRNA (cytosine(1402)-N(4))-methyltransferase [Bacteroidota bacterium]
MYRKPVLLKESVDGLLVKPNGVYVDVTFGGGGHSKAILDQLIDGRLLAFDQDDDALENAFDDDRFTLIHSNFRHLKNFLQLYQAVPVDGILADLGISSHQIDDATRGFSTRFENLLDLRMDRRQTVDAVEVLNTYNEDDLISIFKFYGELKNARQITRLIISGRDDKKIETTNQLKELLQKCAPKHKDQRFFAQVFQALRIEVNQELESLKEFLEHSLDVLKPGGRLSVISYHSLEDRLVKNFLKSGNFEGVVEKDFYGNPITPFNLVNRKLIIPTDQEIELNNRARSAKLRIAEKK